MADTWLKQSTSITVVIGPIWSTTDGALKADLAYNASGINCDIYKNGTKADVTLANAAGDGYFRAGSGEALYLLTLSTGHTDTLGMLEISLSATGYYMKPRSYMVVPANVWDSMFGADYLKTEVVEISGDSTAADNLEADYDGTGYAKTASTTKLHSDYDAAKTAASQSSVNTIDDFIDTEVAAILAAVDTEVAAIKAKTDNLPASPAAVGSAMTLASGAITAAVVATGAIDADALATDAVSEIADGVWDEALSGHTTSGSAGAGLTAAGAAGDPWSTTLPGAYGAGTAGLLLGTTIPNAIDAVDNFVDTEVAAVLAAVDTEVAAIKAKTDNLPADPADQSAVEAAIAAAVPSASTIADAVCDEALSGHTTPGTVGKALADAGAAADPLASAVPGSYAEGTAGYIIGNGTPADVDEDAIANAIVASLGSGSVTVVAPVSVDGESIELVQGDDYANADGRALTWSSDAWPDLTGATVTLNIVAAAGTVSISCTVVTAGAGATQTVRAEPTATNTAALDVGFNAFDVKAVLATSSHVVRLALGSVRVMDAVG